MFDGRSLWHLRHDFFCLGRHHLRGLHRLGGQFDPVALRDVEDVVNTGAAQGDDALGDPVINMSGHGILLSCRPTPRSGFRFGMWFFSREARTALQQEQGSDVVIPRWKDYLQWRIIPEDGKAAKSARATLHKPCVEHFRRDNRYSPSDDFPKITAKVLSVAIKRARFQ